MTILEAIVLVVVITFFIYRWQQRRAVCQIGLKINELAARLTNISARQLTIDRRSVLQTAERHLAMARYYHQRREFSQAEQCISLGHLNAHHAESESDSH